MLYNFRIRNKKDFFNCDIKTIIKAFDTCKKSLECMNHNNMIGGFTHNEIIKLKNMKKNLMKLILINDKKL